MSQEVNEDEQYEAYCSDNKKKIEKAYDWYENLSLEEKDNIAILVSNNIPLA